jgi:lysosomal acid lipase/cholesteryl ester hydrolase
MRSASKIFIAYATLVVSLHATAAFDDTEFDIVANLVGESVALLADQKYVKDDTVPRAFREYALKDNSNDEFGRSSPQEMITRAGFNFENHYVVSDDGYVTQLIRIINPLADQSKLKQPPVMLLQGGITDVTIWVWASIKQHHPEKYPRTVHDGPITSWNRSMAFTLSNNGYDVWLVSHRGANEQNQGHIDLKRKYKLPGRKFAESSHNESTLAELSQNPKRRELGDIIRYWDYTFDDLADYEVPRHIDKVLEVTGASNVTYFPMSFSTIYALMGLSRHPHYQRKIHNTIVFGPIMNNRGSNRILRLFHNSICNLIPVELGTLVVTELFFSQAYRDLNLFYGERKDMRYAILNEFLKPLSGPSGRFQTLLEPAVYGHINMPTGFKMIKHWCQVVSSGKMRRFDHGPLRNKKLYGDFLAPDYNMDVLDFGNWIVVSGEYDVLATRKSVEQYMSTIKPKPIQHIYVKGYNHVDLWAGTDNDVKINLPVLKFLEECHMPSQEF